MALDDYLQGRDERAVRERRMRSEGRLPPGQSLTLKWPVLHDGEVPAFDPATWDFRIGGLVEEPLVWSWDEFTSLPRVEVVSDFHCVTRWSTFDNRWEGVPARAVLGRVRPRKEATHVMVVGHKGETRYGYSTNVPLADLDRPDVLFVLRHNGRSLEAEHGGPMRLVIPHLYAWKSAKWVRGLIFMDADKPGYWERGGYHMRGDPFREERFG
ncbi:MAG TPA: sulfite oxidase-like oxidoreductase [Vicinamibacteria bacterium]|nr:sulfite oxidase-like oxidoreductase [Vicinamibacteria bacterium]